MDAVPRPMTPAEVCARLGFDWSYLQTLKNASGDLRLAPAGLTPGGFARYAPADVERWERRFSRHVDVEEVAG